MRLLLAVIFITILAPKPSTRATLTDSACGGYLIFKRTKKRSTRKYAPITPPAKPWAITATTGFV